MHDSGLGPSRHFRCSSNAVAFGVKRTGPRSGDSRRYSSKLAAQVTDSTIRLVAVPETTHRLIALIPKIAADAQARAKNLAGQFITIGFHFCTAVGNSFPALGLRQASAHAQARSFFKICRGTVRRPLGSCASTG
jgi:hypothetical protein